MLFDEENARVGFARADCSYDRLVAKEAAEAAAAASAGASAGVGPVVGPDVGSAVGVRDALSSAQPARRGGGGGAARDAAWAEWASGGSSSAAAAAAAAAGESSEGRSNGGGLEEEGFVGAVAAAGPSEGLFGWWRVAAGAGLLLLGLVLGLLLRLREGEAALKRQRGGRYPRPGSEPRSELGPEQGSLS